MATIDQATEQTLKQRSEEILSRIIDHCRFEDSALMDRSSSTAYTWQTLTRKHSHAFDTLEIQRIKHLGPMGTWRVRVEMNHPASRVFDLLWPAENSTKHSTSIVTSNTLLSIDEHCQVAYHQHKSPAIGISKRDFCILRTHRTMSDGRIVIAQSSVDLPDLCPEKKGYVRGELDISGFVLQPHPTDPAGKCIVHYAIRSDPRGRMPKFLLDMGMKNLDKKMQLIDRLLQSR